MIEVLDAKRLLDEEVVALDAIEVPAEEALGLVLAEAVQADRDMPPADLSTMDGFAVRAADAGAPGAVLRIAGELRAGEAPRAVVGPHEALRIFTGAMLPPGADAVVMVERTREASGESVEIVATATRGDHIRRRGEDVKAGATLLPAGTVVRAAEVGVLMSVGKVRVRVYRPPVVHVLSTGDELVEPDHVPETHQVRDSNRVTLLAQLRQLGLHGVSLGVAKDEASSLEQSLRQGLKGDVLLITGGVSMGEYDLVGAALERAGMRLLFHQVAVRPGKPILAGRVGACLVIGLPGNPVSTFTGFSIFVAPALRKMMGHAHGEPVAIRARLTSGMTHKPGRTTYHLARLDVSEGALVATPVRTMGSGDLGSLSRANAFVVTDGAARQLPAGSEVTAIPWHASDLR